MQTVNQIVKKFPTLCGTSMFITVFTRAHHWSVSWARSIQYTFPILFPKDPF